MTDTTNCEKLAGVFNRAGQQGKLGFCKMLWGNQSDTVQTQLMSLVEPEILAALQSDP